MWQIAVHLAVAGGVYGTFLCCPLSCKMSWMRSLTSLSQFLRVFLSILANNRETPLNLKGFKLYNLPQSH